MPIIHVTVTKKLPADVKAELMEYFAEQICANTSTLSKNIYVTYMRWTRKMCESLLQPFLSTGR
ncbi:unknown [Firmicutes bacterium CAG:240]|jgi:hypothetical protein|nr:unknown [Firmicutes bacterium CAG:240]